MNFINELNSIIRGDEKKYGSEGRHFMEPTGFACFDYLNGEIITKKGKDKQINIGLDSGKIVTIIGKSGSGKTTLALQMGYNLIKNYEQGSMFILDFEQGTNKERLKQITGMSDDYLKEHVTLLQEGISTNSLYKLIMQIKELKLNKKKDLLVDNPYGIRDENGDIEKVLPPTIIVVDSIAVMMPEDQMNQDELQGQMTATSIARINTQLFKRISQPCATANIIVLFINHINQKIETSVIPTQAQVNYLSQNETLPGGNACIYLTNTLIRVTTANKLEEDKGYQIKGFLARVSLVKSRSAPAGRSVDMVYNQREGFDNDLSLLEYIKSCGKLKGAGVSFKLEGLEDHPFRLSVFKTKLKEDKVFADYFYSLSKSLLEASISESTKVYQEPIVEPELPQETIDEIFDETEEVAE